MKPNKLRLAVLADSSSEVSMAFFSAFARAQRKRNCEIVAAYDCGESGALYRLLAFRNSFKHHTLSDCLTDNVVSARGGEVNSDAMLDRISKLKLDGAICCGVPYKLRPELVKTLKYTINYHNSLLPAYGGRGSAMLAAWHGEKITGWTLHLLTDKTDSGNILDQESCPIEGDIHKLDIRMAKDAGEALSRLIDAGKFGSEGRRQAKHNKSYYGLDYWLKTITVEDISQLSYDEYQPRLDIFGYIRTRHNGKYVYVTSVKPLRIYYLPPWLWGIINKVVKV